MKLKDVKENLDKLDSQQQEAIINLIDLKTENDMKEVMTQFSITNAKIESVNGRMDGIKNQMQVQIASIKWFVVSAIAILGIVIAVMNYSNNQRNYSVPTNPAVEIKK